MMVLVVMKGRERERERGRVLMWQHSLCVAFLIFLLVTCRSFNFF